jgi:hypothetical protein
VNVEERLNEHAAEIATLKGDLRNALHRLDEQESVAQERLVAVKQERFDAQADAMGAAQQRDKADAQKRKAEADLQEESKRHRSTAAELSAAAARDEEQQEARVCCVCLDRQASVFYAPCGHVKVCGQCDNGLEECPCCQEKIKERYARVYE